MSNDEEDNSPVTQIKLSTEVIEDGSFRLHFWWATEATPDGYGVHGDYDSIQEAINSSAMLLLNINGDIH